MKKRFNCEEECRFCEIFDKKGQLNKVDMPIEINDRFMALASIGAMVKGWTLIISREHTYSMKDFYDNSDFQKFVNNVTARIREVYHKKCIIFEHGANILNSLTACGTNHAHLHIVPYSKSLIDEMMKDECKWVRCSVAEIKEIVQGNEYWFYAENVEEIEYGKGYLHIIEQPESQYFRKLIAKKEKCENQYNYKEYLFLKNAEDTYEMLKR